jgi:membrane protease YdiL (CAAX protease family)
VVATVHPVSDEGRPRSAPAPVACLVGTVAWTWCFLGLAILTGRPWLAFPTVLLTIVGFLGPVVVPSLFIRARRWHEPVGAFWRRSLDPRTLPWRWYGTITLLAAALVVVPAAMGAGGVPRLQSGPVAFLLVGALAGAVEEPCWRGYGQEGLQRRMPVFAAAFVVAGFWIAWHLPMFVLEGTYQHGIGIGTRGFWLFNAALLLVAPIYAWLYTASGRVVFAAVWFHAISNVLQETVDSAPATGVTVTAVAALLLVTVSWCRMRSTTRWSGRADRPPGLRRPRGPQATSPLDRGRPRSSATGM